MMLGTRKASAGLTMIELMVVVGIAGLLAMVAAPSFKRFIDVQRLRSVNSQLITDIQFVRAEAASRNDKVVIMFDRTGTSVTCYAIFTGDHTRCDCNLTPGNNVCTAGFAREIRTVQVPRDTSITLGVPTGQAAKYLRFDPATGRIETAVSDTFVPPDEPFVVEVTSPGIGGFRTSVAVTGRPSTCTPSGQISGVPTCL